MLEINKDIVAIARRLLVSIWHILTKREPYRHFDEETIAYKMLTFVPLRGYGPGPWMRNHGTA